MSPTSTSTPLRQCKPHLSTDLVDEQALHRLSRIAVHLPLETMVALEVRLPADRPQVDCAVRSSEPGQVRHLAARLRHSPDFLRDFMTSWANDAGAPKHPVHSIWLEFDLARDPGPHLPDPVVCARLRHSAALEQVAEDLLPRMHGASLSPLQNRLFRTAWNAIPESCRPLYLFSLRARGSQAIRLETYGEDLETALAWPRLAHHPGAAEPLPWIRSRVPALENADRFHVSLDLGSEGWFPRIGVEASFRRQPPREPGWAGLLDNFVEGGLCDPHKRRALEAWIGQTRFESGKLVRALSHVKLSFPGDGEAGAKGYLMVQHLPHKSVT